MCNIYSFANMQQLFKFDKNITKLEICNKNMANKTRILSQAW